MSRSNAFIVSLALAVTGTAACSKEPDRPRHKRVDLTEQPAAPSAQQPGAGLAAVSEEAQKMFRARCVACHGERGKGDGPGSAALNPKPRDYTNVAWQRSVTDEQIKSTIVMGGAAVGKSPIMPANPDLQSKEDVVAGLVTIVRSFGGK